MSPALTFCKHVAQQVFQGRARRFILEKVGGVFCFN